MRALARYGLQDAARRTYDTLSGGQKARLEILCLELEGHNLLLLDEPTDNLDIDSSEALESALDGVRGHGRRRLARPRVPAPPRPLPACSSTTARSPSLPDVAGGARGRRLMPLRGVATIGRCDGPGGSWEPR